VPPACTICRHKRRAQIEAALVAGESLRHIEKRWGVGYSAVARHKHRCVAPVVAAAAAAVEEAYSERLIDQVRGLQARTIALVVEVEGVLSRARKPAAKLGAVVVAAKVVKEIRGNMELLGRLTGELETGSKVTVNLITNPLWLELRRAISDALRPYHEADEAVAAAVKRLGA